MLRNKRDPTSGFMRRFLSS